MTALLPPQFLFRYRFPIPRIDGLPQRRAGGLLELPAAARLPAPAAMADGNRFADIRAAWNADGLGVSVRVSGKRRPPKCNPEKPADSDGLQLWLDTRDTKTIHRAGRYCHWFCLLPCGAGAEGEAPCGAQLPVPRAREDAPLCDPEDLLLSSELQPDGYLLEAWLPAEVLHGFDPESQPRLGVYTVVVDEELGPQPLAVGDDYPYSSDPSLWATLELVASSGDHLV